MRQPRAGETDARWRIRDGISRSAALSLPLRSGVAVRVAGVDVGAERKGFHAVVLEDRRVIEGPLRLGGGGRVGDVIDWLAERSPSCVAVDSPRRPAPRGEASRADERRFASLRVCGIRFTPDLATLERHPSGYYDWILNGFRLYRALEGAAERAGWELVECFPTATWTVHFTAPRGAARRSAWTTAALAQLGLEGLPQRRLSQDDRDAIAAACMLCWRRRPREATKVGEDLVIATGPIRN